MEQAVQDLVKMGDIESLYEVMTEHDDFIYSLDAAEGLIRLDDIRGVDFLLDALESEDEDIRDMAREILEMPEIISKRKALEGEAETKEDNSAALAAVRQRIAEGKKAFIYKTIYLPASRYINPDPSDDGDYVAALNDFGFEGWEVVAFFPVSILPGGVSPVSINGRVTGGHFLIKKEVTANDSADLEDL